MFPLPGSLLDFKGDNLVFLLLLLFLSWVFQYGPWISSLCLSPKKGWGKACNPCGESIVVKHLDLKSMDLQFTPSYLNVIWSLSSVCLSFTLCEMRLRVFLVIDSEECYWDVMSE